MTNLFLLNIMINYNLYTFYSHSRIYYLIKNYYSIFIPLFQYVKNFTSFLFPLQLPLLSKYNTYLILILTYKPFTNKKELILNIVSFF
jgi:hypothetical protein